MRRRRDPFARVTLIPEPTNLPPRSTCDWCGTLPYKGRPIRQIRQEHDGGRVDTLRGAFCSWECAESFHGHRLGGA